MTISAIMDTVTPFLVAYLIVLAYGVLRLRILRAVESERIRAANEADDLARDERLSADARLVLRAMVENQFAPAQPWRMLGRTLAAYIVPRRVKAVRRNVEPENPDLRQRFYSVGMRLTLFGMLNSPLAFLLLVLASLLASAVYASINTVQELLTAASERGALPDDHIPGHT